MFCSNCGNQIADNANFCFVCGAKVGNSSSTNAEDHSKEAQQEIVKEFDIGYAPFTIGLTADLVKHNSVRSVLEKREQVDEKAVEHIVAQFTKSDDYDIDTMFFNLTTDGTIFERVVRQYGEPPQTAVDILQKHKIYHIDKETLFDIVFSDESIKARIMPIKKAEMMIEEFKTALENKDPSFRFRGGGFGIKGAVMGTVKAEALNLGMDAVSGLAKVLTGNTDSDKLTRAKATIIKELRLVSAYYSFAHAISEGIIDKTIKILHKEVQFPLATYDSSRFLGTYRNIVRANINKKISLRDTVDKMCRLIETYPYHLYPYRYIYRLAPVTKSGLIELADYLGMELESVLEYDHDHPDKIPGLS